MYTTLDNLVTIETYKNGYEAHIAKASLEEDGIYVFLAGVETAKEVAGEVQLQVPSGDVERARDILAKTVPARTKAPNTSSDDWETCVCLSCGQDMPDDADRCPKCGWTFHCPDE